MLEHRQVIGNRSALVRVAGVRTEPPFCLPSIFPLENQGKGFWLKPDTQVDVGRSRPPPCPRTAATNHPPKVCLPPPPPPPPLSHN